MDLLSEKQYILPVSNGAWTYKIESPITYIIGNNVPHSTRSLHCTRGSATTSLHLSLGSLPAACDRRHCER